jgi:tetrapyrrole methylase family protein/MazG family protein
VASEQPDLLLMGYGVGDGLQITVESQRALARLGRCYVVGIPPNLERYLRSLHIECVDLTAGLASDRPFADAYLEIAEAILQEVSDDPPVVVLSPGNPLLSNALNRFLMIKARERKLRVQVLPAVSPIDVLVCATGLDVGTFGLQVFDARRLVARGRPIDPGVPLLLLQLAGVAATTPGAPLSRELGAYALLTEALLAWYPVDHPVTHLGDGSEPGAARLTTVPLARFEEIVPQIGTGSTLFVDLVRPANAPAG